MLKHIVMFKVKTGYDVTTKNELTAKLKNKLENLKTTIHQIHSFEVGVNISTSANAYDLVLVSTFANETELKVYREHPDHQHVLAFIKEITESLRVVDYHI
jgi:hypothetical protein